MKKDASFLHENIASTDSFAPIKVTIYSTYVRLCQSGR